MPPRTPKFARPGDPIYAADWNAMQRAVAPELAQGAPFGGAVPNMLEAGWFWVKNTNGTDLNTFEIQRLNTDDLFSIATLDLTTDSAKGIIMKIVDVGSTADPVYCVALEPIKASSVGRACLLGLTRVKVLAGTTTYRAATISGRKLQPASSGPIKLLTAPKSAAESIGLTMLGAGASSPLRMFKTPSGGIPAASGSTPGSATCTEYPAGMGGAAGSTATVKNHRTSIIPGEVHILVLAFGADLYCVEGNCPTLLTDPGEPV